MTDFKPVDWNKPLSLRGITGTTLDVVSHHENDDGSVLVVAKNLGGNHVCVLVNKDGRAAVEFVFNKPERRSLWANVYDTSSVASYYETREYADINAAPSRKAVLEIIYEDDEPIEVKLHKGGK